MARKAKRYDCGPAGHLTMTEIADRAGIALSTVRLRVLRGVAGEDLLAYRVPSYNKRTRSPSWDRDACFIPPPGVNAMVYLALRLVREFTRPPTVAQLTAKFGMSKATAYRWRKAWVEAQALDAARAGTPPA